MSDLHDARSYLAIARQFVRIGLIRKSQFRVEFFSQVVMDVVFYVTHVLTFEILFARTPTIAGWSVEEVRVFLGFLFVSDAFLMMWLGQGWHFGRELKDGALDPLRVRPGSPIFLYFFQRFSLEACFNMALALAYLLYAMGQAEVGFAPGVWLILPWALVLTCWARFALSVLFTIWEFYALNSDLGHFTHELSMAGADRPLDIFSRRVRLFLITLLPVGALTHVPASLVLGRTGVWTGLIYSLWLVLFGLAACRWWRRGFRRYESAMS